MIINWFGQACFKIQGEKSIIVTDPFDKSIGLKIPRLSADIVTVSHDHYDHNNIKGVKGIAIPEPFIITESGEYEIKNTFVYGISSYHDNQEGKIRGENIIYRIEMEGITLAHLGDLGHLLTNGQVEKLEGVDILMIPIGGIYTINAKQAGEVISQLEPRIVIPMHYKIKGLKVNIDSLDKFCKEIGVCPTETITKFKVTKKDLSQEEMKIIVLQP